MSSEDKKGQSGGAFEEFMNSLPVAVATIIDLFITVSLVTISIQVNRYFDRLLWDNPTGKEVNDFIDKMLDIFIHMLEFSVIVSYVWNRTKAHISRIFRDR